MPPKLGCPHCGNDDQQQITPWIEPTSQITEEANMQREGGKKYYCEQCGKTWVVQRLPLEGPNARS